MSRIQTPITEALSAYVREVTLREPEVLRRLRESTENHPDAGLQIAPEQGQFLHLLTRLSGGRMALEVGAFMGYSSTWMALAMPPEGRLTVCDVNPEYIARARETWKKAGVEGKVEVRLGPALESLDRLLSEGCAGTFDIAFLDADKENYENYYERALQLVRSGGLVVADNVLWRGYVADPKRRDEETEIIRRFNRRLSADPRVASSLAIMGDGFALACKL